MKQKKYDQEYLSTVNTKVKHSSGKVNISITCHLKVSKFQVPCQAETNNLCLNQIPEAIKILNKLETSFLCKLLLFKKVVIMAKGQSPKFIGAVVNVPVDVNETFDKLPNLNHIVFIKLKKN